MRPPPGPPDSRPVLARLVDLAAPIVGLNVLNVLALAVDTAMCGRLPNAEPALTGLGFAVQIAFLLMVAMMGLTVGTVATVARAHGAGHQDRVQHVLVQASGFTIALSLLVAVGGNAAAPSLLRLLGASGDAYDGALLYLRPILLGTVFSYLNILYAAVLRGVGNTRLPFFVVAVANVINVVLNYGLILGNWGLPALGLQGAALGTIAAQGFAACTLAALLGRGVQPGLCFPLAVRKPDLDLGRTLFRIGAPAAADMVVINAAFLSIIGMLGRLEPTAVAAHGIGLRVQALAFVPGMSIAQATGALVGQALGAGRVEEAKAIARSAVLLSCGVMSTLGAVLLAGAYPIVGLFDIPRDAQLAELSVLWMRMLAYGFPLVGMTIAFGGMLQGAGDTKTPLRINLVATFLLQIPLSWALGFPAGLGPMGVWMAFPLSFLLRSAAMVVVYRRGRWARVGAEA